MQSYKYNVQQYVADIRSIAASESDETRIIERIKPLAKRLAATSGWIKDAYRQCDPDQGFGVHLLYEEDDHDLAVFILTWLPDRGTLPHNHCTWAVVAAIEGEEDEVNWERLDDGTIPGYAELKKIGTKTLRAGDVTGCRPHDIHSVWNSGKELSISLHTYGHHLNFTGRSEFDPEARIERPFIVKVED